jgi:hypothetical protein
MVFLISVHRAIEGDEKGNLTTTPRVMARVGYGDMMAVSHGPQVMT